MCAWCPGRPDIPGQASDSLELELQTAVSYGAGAGPLEEQPVLLTTGLNHRLSAPALPPSFLRQGLSLKLEVNILAK